MFPEESIQYLYKTAYQLYVTVAKFLNNKRSHTVFKTFFFLEAYQNQYVKLQPNNKEFTERRRQQQLVTCNTPSYSGYNWFFIIYFVLTVKKQ